MMISYERALAIVEAIGLLAACSFVLGLLWTFLSRTETAFIVTLTSFGIVIVCAIVHMRLIGHEPWE